MVKLTVSYLISCQKPIISIAKRGILLALMASVSILACGASPSYGQERLSASGITEPIKDVTLSVSMAGTIATIFFKEGAHIEKGQSILELDNKLEELEVERRKLLWECKAEVESAAAQVATLKSLLESTRELFKSTASVSKEELEKMELEYELAIAEHQRLDVVDTSKCLFVCNVEEWIGRTLRKGQSVHLRIRTGSKSTAKKGTIVFASPVVDPASGLLEVKAKFDNRDGAVRPGVAGVILLKAP